jgi:hypothetical protein
VSSFAAMHMSLPGTSLISRNVRLESAKRANADIDQIAVANCDFMSTRPSTTLADFERDGIPESVFQ